MYNFGYYPHDYEEDEELPETKRDFQLSGTLSETKKLAEEYKCIRCKDWFPWVQPNQEDGSFICYCCRQDEYR